jgi:hypothetical protein
MPLGMFDLSVLWQVLGAVSNTSLGFVLTGKRYEQDTTG